MPGNCVEIRKEHGVLRLRRANRAAPLRMTVGWVGTFGIVGVGRCTGTSAHPRPVSPKPERRGRGTRLGWGHLEWVRVSDCRRIRERQKHADKSVRATRAKQSW